MAEAITIEQLKNARLDAESLELAINGDSTSDVITRQAKTYPTLAKALRLIVENGLLGATPFRTFVELQADAILSDNDFAVVTNDADIVKNGMYQKISGSWTYLKYNYQKLLDYSTLNLMTKSHSDLDMFSTTIVTQASDTRILEIGYTEEAIDPVSNRPYLGDKIAINDGEYYYFEIYVTTTTPNNFGIPRLYFWNSQSPVLIINLEQISKISDTIAVYKASGQLDLSDVSKFLIGINNASDIDRVSIFGLRYAIDKKPIINIVDKPVVVDPSKISLDIADNAIAEMQRPTARYNTLIIYGQSLGAGYETFPALSKTNFSNNLTLGNNVRPSQKDSDNYQTFGSDTLMPLSAQVVSASSQLLTDEDVKLLSAGNTAIGEPPNFGFVNSAKNYLIDKLLDDNPRQQFVTINPSVGGKTIEQLSKNNTQDNTNRYGRYLDGITKIQTAVDDTHVISALAWMQGEYNYKDKGGSWDKESYKTLLNQLINDMQSDAIAVTYQKKKPVFLTYQTGASYTQNVDSNGKKGLHVGMAQLEVANERDDTFMFAPAYPYTDKGGHLDSNGSRWIGNKIAQVYKHVVLDRKNWSPLQPIKIRQNGKHIRIDFYVPVPPLVFDSSYLVNNAVMYEAKGFKVTDETGDIKIIDVDVSATHIDIITEAIAGKNAHVWYASMDTDGNGNLRDSDNSLAFDKYEYVENSGMYDSANISTLNDKPYPLHNWCVAFYLPVDYTYTAT